MKKLTLTLLALLALMLTGCENPPKLTEDVLFSNSNWCIVKLNDSTILCIPNSQDATPTIINTHDLDRPCQEKGGEQ